ncbi:membrane protein [Mycobacterium phage ScoobyDoobyDoo]|nr:membrane protein [Mycobacterium phage ScoobyDoobyDoo]
MNDNTARKATGWGERVIRLLPYLIIILAIWRMAQVDASDDLDLASGLQALFLALAAIFLKLDLRERKEDRNPTILHAKIVQLTHEEDSSDITIRADEASTDTDQEKAPGS